MERDDTVKFERNIIDNSNTPQVSIAKEMMAYLDAQIGDYVGFKKTTGKYGRFGRIRVCSPDDDEFLVKRKIISNNGTPQFSLPDAIMSYLDFQIGNVVRYQPDKHGGQKAMTFWNPNQQRDD